MDRAIRRHALSDRQWGLIKNLLPENGHRGRRWKDHRSLIDGILWILRTGSPWRDLPDRFGPWKTVYERFRRWTREGLWDRVLAEVQGERQRRGKIDWRLFAIDSTIVRAHKAAAGAERARPMNEPADHAIGRSRGGLSTKIHLVCDRTGMPMSVSLSPGQAHDLTACVPLVDSLQVRTGGRMRRRPDRLAGDKAYSSHSFRCWLKARRIVPVIPTRSDQPRDERFDRRAYRERNVVERLFCRLKECRRLATRYEKLALHYLGFLHLGMLIVSSR
jgi:transposase